MVSAGKMALARDSDVPRATGDQPLQHARRAGREGLPEAGDGDPGVTAREGRAGADEGHQVRRVREHDGHSQGRLRFLQCLRVGGDLRVGQGQKITA